MEHVSESGVIQFRHPDVEKNGYGMVIKKQVSKLSSREQATIDDDLVWLFKVRIKSRAEAMKLRALHPKAADTWFKPIEAQERQRELERRAKTPRLGRAPTDDHKQSVMETPEGNLKADERLQVEIWKREDAEKDAKEANKKAAELEKAMADMGQKFGQLGLKREGITLGECVKHFDAKVMCESEDAKQALMTRVNKVVEKLGTGTPHSAVGRKAIEDAVTATCPVSKNEARVRRSAIKRFFVLLSAPPSSDGLGLPNPAAMLKVGSGKAIQTERQQEGLVTMLDPADLLKNKRLSPYWKALIATLGYGGLRLIEAAAMEWDRVPEPDTEYPENVFQVRTTRFYTKLKSYMSLRDAKPFPNVFPFLKAYKKVKEHESLVFPRKGKAGPTWFKEYKGKAKAYALSRALTFAVGAAIGMDYTLKDGTVIKVKSQSRAKVNGVDTLYLRLWDDSRVQYPRADVLDWDREGVALRLRHFWETTMRANGLGHLIEAMGGHEEATGQLHYTVHSKVVAAAEIPLLKTK